MPGRPISRAPATIARYGGRYLARGGAIDVIEGNWSPLAIVLVEFPDRDAAARWYASPEYAEALRIRGSKLHRNMIVVEGTGGDGIGGDGAGGLLGPGVVQR
jgi:uncharacterized protein (DUF1330 family)